MHGCPTGHNPARALWRAFSYTHPWTQPGTCLRFGNRTLSTQTSDALASGLGIGGRFLDNDSPHNFAKLGKLHLQAAKFTNAGFANVPEWPTYDLAFHALEVYLKSYLLMRGATLEHVHRVIGHKLRDAMADAKSKGLSLNNLAPGFEDSVMKLSELYTKREFQYRNIGQWELLPPDYVIAFVEHVGAVVGLD